MTGFWRVFFQRIYECRSFSALRIQSLGHATTLREAHTSGHDVAKRITEALLRTVKGDPVIPPLGGGVGYVDLNGPSRN